MLESTTKFTGERYELGMLWSEPESNLTNNYSSALGQHYSLDRKIPKGPTPEKSVSTVNRYRCRRWIRKDIEGIRSEKHLREGMIFSTQSSDWFAMPHQSTKEYA